jgi:hypothetical protein
MGLQRFVEYFRPDENTFKQHVQRRKITESEIKSLSANLSSMRLSEAVKKYFESHPVATLEGKTVWRFPVSRYDWKNDNGRVYEKRLWQRVIDEQKDSYQGNLGLADHPKDDEDGKFKESCIVWLNLGLDESSNLVWGEGIFVGDHGKLAEEILEAGGRVGFSSSGFGELEESDKSTVRWDSYQLERPADVVLNPSQKVYGTFDMKVDKNKDSLTHESTKKIEEKDEKKCCVCGAKIEGETKYFKDSKPCCSQACASADKKDTKKENTPMNSSEKLSKLEERKFRKDVGVFLEEADRITNPQEKLGQLTEILSYFNEGITPDLKEQVEAKIKESKIAIEKAVVEQSKLVETFGVDNVDTVKESIKKIAVDTQLYERDASEWKAIATGLQEKNQKLMAILNSRPTAEAYKTALAFSTRMKETFKKKEDELLFMVSELKSKIAKQTLIENQMIKELASISGVNKKLTENNQKLREYGLKLRNRLLEYKAAIKAEEEVLQEKAEKAKEIAINPTKKSNKMFDGFTEDREVASYYTDLLKRHGPVIETYKEELLGCKTLREAMKLYTDILSELSILSTSRISDALDPEERQKIIESQTGMRIRKQSEFEKRLPQGWE